MKKTSHPGDLFQFSRLGHLSFVASPREMLPAARSLLGSPSSSAVSFSSQVSPCWYRSVSFSQMLLVVASMGSQRSHYPEFTTFASKSRALAIDFDVISHRAPRPSHVEVKPSYRLNMSSKLARPSQSSSSHGCVQLVRRCRDPLICLCPGLQRSPCRRDLVIPSIPFLLRIARLGLVNHEAKCTQISTCFGPQTVRLILVSTDQEIVSIRDESHPRPLSVHLVQLSLASCSRK